MVREPKGKCPICGADLSGGRCPQVVDDGAALCSLIFDIHDGLVQNLFAAFSQVHNLRQVLAQSPGANRGGVLDQGLRRVGQLIGNSLREIRGFVRAFGPEEVGSRDLPSMVEGLALEYEDLTGMQIVLEVNGSIPSVPLPVKIAVYRILQEAFSNTYRHAQASRQWVRLSRVKNELYIEIEDDGKGFEPERFLGEEGEARTGRHLGLKGMRDRVHTLGGRFEVKSTPGRGTIIRVWIPCFGE